ncbi:hypothetical protein ES332_D11G403400v1 [Gossypium tomentosum]|uniref:Uncharacterized protein n=1 Tax=Gossypium tomentosum TaxID=34277 RepID=A0A5D2IY11_GOSTO|nr:hypothetical protein ES332_D11G403400v1 [Gossypium tomentosum]TYH47319.1 hypothetical protein ES332_D11G403400v1 [Gossypium tomentosum]TYH47320.1 hypothetical protein ES332_D11G403400v1 [Gossypium tomentosum]
MTNWSCLRGHRDIVTTPTPGAPNGADGQRSADHYQVNSSSSMMTGGKKRNQKDKGKGRGIKKQCLARVTGEEESVGELTVQHSGKIYTDQINRRICKVKEKLLDWLRNCPEVISIINQIEEKWPLLSELQKIKEKNSEIQTEFKAGRLKEDGAMQKMDELKERLNRVDGQLQEFHKANNVEELNKVKKLETMFLKNEEYDVETLEKEFFSAVPSTQGVAATGGHESLSTFGGMDIPICGIEQKSPWHTIGEHYYQGMLEQGGSEASEAQYNTNTPPLSHSDNQMNLMLSGSNKRDGVSEAGVQVTEMNDVTIPVDQDHESLLAREMLKRNYSSWLSGLFNKDNNSVEVAHFHGLQEALDETRYGETPDYLKRIATLIEVDRGKATKFGHKNIEVLVCAAFKEMEDWRTPKDSGCNQLKKWAATLNMGKEQDFEVKFADDTLNNICLACYASLMIYGGDGSIQFIPLGNTITSGMLQKGGREASEAQYNTNTPPLSHSDNQMNLMLSGSNKRDGVSEAGVQGTEMNDVTITVDQDHGSLLAGEILKRNYSSWLSGLFNKDNNSVEVAHFHGLQEALDKTRYGETPDYLKGIAALIEVDRGKATKFGHKNIEVLVCAAIKEMEDWRTPKDSGYNQLKKWAATLNMGKEQDFEVKLADDMLNNICLACYAYLMIYGEDGSVHKVASGRV